MKPEDTQNPFIVRVAYAYQNDHITLLLTSLYSIYPIQLQLSHITYSTLIKGAKKYIYVYIIHTHKRTP